uniref:STAS domain-containing protein n=1 Tax=Rhabditophanes sp. KR3021 TaxID=114890 RepID=A0AC35UFS2_9BILA
MNQSQFDEVYQKVSDEIIKGGKTSRKLNLKSTLFSFVPILSWLPNYKFAEYFQGDFIAGATCAIMHVPQGMAYASLIPGLPLIHGVYSSFFASFVYMFFGTSRHISVGVFAVGSMMVGSVVSKFSEQLPSPTNLTMSDDSPSHLDPLILISSITFLVGIIQVTMGALKLGFMTNYMSDALVSGFTTGSACHVMMSQLSKVFGYKINKYSGFGMLVFMAKEIIEKLVEINWLVFGIAMFGLVFLLVGKEFVNPWFKQYSKVPIPLELSLVVIGTVVSIVFNLGNDYHVPTVNHITNGFPLPRLPDFTLIPSLFLDCLSIAVVCYMFIISMGKLFAKKHKYIVDSTQELYACGFMSILGSMFPIYPSGASLSRSSVCEMSGVKTQLNALFSSFFLVIVIMWLGKYVEPLPMCILASIVISSLKPLFMQFSELPRLWKINKYDFMIWLIAFSTTTFINVTSGLAISLGFTVLTIALREQFPKIFELGTDSKQNYFKPLNNYENLCKASDKVSILKFESPLHFANTTAFTDKITEMIEEICSTPTKVLNNVELDQKNDITKYEHSIILDCSAISYIDTMGLESLEKAAQECHSMNLAFYLVDVNDDVFKVIARHTDKKELVMEDIYPSIGDVLVNL